MLRKKKKSRKSEAQNPASICRFGYNRERDHHRHGPQGTEVRGGLRSFLLPGGGRQSPAEGQRCHREPVGKLQKANVTVKKIQMKINQNSGFV